MKYVTNEIFRLPPVSIIMNCYDGAKYLREAINSVYAQNVSKLGNCVLG